MRLFKWSTERSFDENEILTILRESFCHFQQYALLHVLLMQYCHTVQTSYHPALFHKLISAGPLLALLVGFSLSFLIGALVRFIKITKAAPLESVEVFRKDPFLALYLSFLLSMIFLLLCLLPSATLFMLTIWPFGPSPPPSLLRWRSSDLIGALARVLVSSFQYEQM